MMQLLRSIAAFFRREGASMGFREVIENPRRAAAPFKRAAAKFCGVMRGKEARLEKAIRQYLYGEGDRWEHFALKQASFSMGERIHPIVLRLLDEIDMNATISIETQGFGGRKEFKTEALLERLSILLSTRPPASIVPRLVPYLASDRREVRQCAVQVIAATGSVDSIEYVRAALTDDKGSNQERAICGLAGAMRCGVMASEVASALFDALVIAQDRGGVDEFVRKEACRILLAFDRERAIEDLTSDRFFGEGAYRGGDAAVVLSEEGVTVPRERLLHLIEKHLRPPIALGPSGEPESVARLLAVHKNPADLALFESLMSYTVDMDGIEPLKRQSEKWSIDQTRSVGAFGFMAFHGVNDPDRAINEALNSDKRHRLSPAQRMWHAVKSLDGQVKNGGFAQYFYNPYGEYWQDALAGFDQMGMVERAELLREALLPYGPKGPSTKQEKRQDQLSEAAQKDRDLYRDIDSRYYACEETIAEYAARFIVQHADAFR